MENDNCEHICVQRREVKRKKKRRRRKRRTTSASLWKRRTMT
jgi:hypothetical protein